MSTVYAVYPVDCRHFTPLLLLYTAHKTGTILAKHLAAAVNVQLGLSCRAALQVDYNCPPDVGAPPAELLRFRRRRLDDEGIMPCVL